MAAVRPDRPSTAVDCDFASRLVAWQRTHGRHRLPWQQLDGPRDAYRVWLAEVMLQQTQVAAVIPYYERFVARFPTVDALAAASQDDVLALWAGLGYYSRARNLHAAARRVVELHDGRFPDDLDALGALPGVGRSTAGAIAAFAFGRRTPILDGNVKRVLARVHAVGGDPTSPAVTRRLWALSTALVPAVDVERYTQALMDLGATVCTPRNPSCLICPVAAMCRARIEGRIDELPAPRARKARPERDTTFVAIVADGAVLVERRPERGIWGGLWSLPEIGAPTVDAAAAYAASYGDVVDVDVIDGFVHGFTHYVLNASALRVRIVVRDEGDEGDAADAAGSAVREPATGRPRHDASTHRWLDPSRPSDVGLPKPIGELVRRPGLVEARRPTETR